MAVPAKPRVCARVAISTRRSSPPCQPATVAKPQRNRKAICAGLCRDGLPARSRVRKAPGKRGLALTDDAGTPDRASRARRCRVEQARIRLSRVKVVGDDPPVAAPPDRLGAHHGAGAVACEVQELGQALSEHQGGSVVGVVPEAGVLPKGVGGRRVATSPLAQSAKRPNVAVADPRQGQRTRQRVGVELRVGPRSRDGTDVDHEVHPGPAQQGRELRDAAGRMTDGANGVAGAHAVPSTATLQSCGGQFPVRSEYRP